MYKCTTNIAQNAQQPALHNEKSKLNIEYVYIQNLGQVYKNTPLSQYIAHIDGLLGST